MHAYQGAFTARRATAAQRSIATVDCPTPERIAFEVHDRLAQSRVSVEDCAGLLQDLDQLSVGVGGLRLVMNGQKRHGRDAPTQHDLIFR